MIALEGVSARSAPQSIANVSLTLGPGVHSIVGGLEDGTGLLMALVAGSVRPRSGRLRVLDGAPWQARIRRQIAHVPLQVRWPESFRVEEVMKVAASLRGEEGPRPVDRLAALGMEALAGRSVRSLTRAEARAAALADAITSLAARVLLLEEPLMAIDPRAAGHVAEALRARARDGCTVVVTTGSLQDAGELADDHVLLRAGAVVGRAPSLEALVGLGPEGVWLVARTVTASDARTLVAIVAREDGVDAVEQDGPSVRARGQEPTSLGRAMARAAVAAGIDVVELRLERPSIEQARAAGARIAATTPAAAPGARSSIAPVPAPPRSPHPEPGS